MPCGPAMQMQRERETHTAATSGAGVWRDQNICIEDIRTHGTERDRVAGAGFVHDGLLKPTCSSAMRTL